MIRTLVVDDDFRVAHIHAASVERVEGFACVGQAHTAAEAREAIAELQPDCCILDIYLPTRTASACCGPSPREGDAPTASSSPPPGTSKTVRSAMKLGAMYYLVKPFGFDQLREQLEAYRRWREGVAQPRRGQADQAQIDALYRLRNQMSSARAKTGPCTRRWPRFSRPFARRTDP